MAVGLSIAQQIIQQQGGLPGVSAPGARGTQQPAMPDLLSPADAAKALGVPESDVMTILESGELQGKKIGTSWRIRRAALDEYLTK
jgi:excisionase family DNA binding protein